MVPIKRYIFTLKSFFVVDFSKFYTQTYLSRHCFSCMLSPFDLHNFKQHYVVNIWQTQNSLTSLNPVAYLVTVY